MTQKTKNDNLFEKLMQSFDNGLMLEIDKQSRLLNSACDRVETKLNSCENTMKAYVRNLKLQTEKELDIAESIVNRELRSKIIVSEWVNGFLSRTRTIALDPVTFAFSRFSLNVSMCYNQVSASYFISSRVHYLLVSLLQFDSEIVVGPALMGLLHLSLHDEMKSEIFMANALPALLKLMAKSESMTILGQACKLCASLAYHSPNKAHLANSGCFHAILDLVAGANLEVEDQVKGFASGAVTNMLNGSDSNRILTIELDAIRPLVYILQLCSYETALLNAVKALANIAYNNSYTAGRILVAGTVNIIIQ